jgi:hypothetical protein
VQTVQEDKEQRTIMEPSLHSAAPAMAHNGAGLNRSSGAEGISYQVMTVAAILVVLLSMWVF